MNITYTPHSDYSKEDWGKHILLFLFVLVTSSVGLAVAEGALWVMALLGFTANLFVLGLAIYENRIRRE